MIFINQDKFKKITVLKFVLFYPLSTYLIFNYQKLKRGEYRTMQNNNRHIFQWFELTISFSQQTLNSA